MAPKTKVLYLSIALFGGSFSAYSKEKANNPHGGNCYYFPSNNSYFSEKDHSYYRKENDHWHP
jgi:hypothetical protein